MNRIIAFFLAPGLVSCVAPSRDIDFDRAMTANSSVEPIELKGYIEANPEGVSLYESRGALSNLDDKRCVVLGSRQPEVRRTLQNLDGALVRARGFIKELKCDSNDLCLSVCSNITMSVTAIKKLQ